MIHLLTADVGTDVGAVRVDTPSGPVVLVDPGVTEVERVALLNDLLSPAEFAYLYPSTGCPDVQVFHRTSSHTRIVTTSVRTCRPICTHVTGG